MRMAISRPNSSLDCAALAASLDAWDENTFTATVCSPSVALYTCSSHSLCQPPPKLLIVQGTARQMLECKGFHRFLRA